MSKLFPPGLYLLPRAVIELVVYQNHTPYPMRNVRRAAADPDISDSALDFAFVHPDGVVVFVVM